LRQSLAFRAEGSVQASRIAALQGMPIFGGIRAEVLDALVEASRGVAVAKGEFFFHEGDPAESMFVLESGEVEVLKGWAGKQYVIGRLRAGDCFGEIALLDLFPRSASILAVAPCSAIELSTASSMKLYETDVAQFALIQMNIARELSRRLRAADERLFRDHVGAEPPAPEHRFLMT
jgi:CRP-like cAMP-binding protein